MKRHSGVFAVTVLCVWLAFVGVAVALTGRAQAPLTGDHDRQPSSIDAGGPGLVSAARSTFQAMLARRNRSVLTGGVGRSTGGRRVALAAALSVKKPLVYEHSAGVSTSGAAATRRVSFGLHTLGMAVVDVVGPSRRLP